MNCYATMGDEKFATLGDVGLNSLAILASCRKDFYFGDLFAYWIQGYCYRFR